MNEFSRVTLVLPTPLWEEVKQIAPAGQRSHWVAEVLEAQLRRQLRLEFQEYLRQKYGELPSSIAEIEQMRAERDDNLQNLR
jgi:hypothetical protein